MQINKDELVYKLRTKTGYTAEDTATFLNAFIDVLRDCIINRDEISVRGLGQLKFTTIKEHYGNRPTKGVKGSTEKILIPETERVGFKLSSDLRNLVKGDYEEDDF